MIGVLFFTTDDKGVILFPIHRRRRSVILHFFADIPDRRWIEVSNCRYCQRRLEKPDPRVGGDTIGDRPMISCNHPPTLDTVLVILTIAISILVILTITIAVLVIVILLVSLSTSEW